jgi:hypothetical protein
MYQDAEKVNRLLTDTENIDTLQLSHEKMAPQVLEHPGARTTRGDLVIKGSVPYVLCRIEDDASLTPVSHHGDFLTGIAAAGHVVEVEDLDFAYALYAGDPSNGSTTTRVASFREGRIGYREWARRRGRINPSVEDRYDHDVDELTA